MCREHLQPIIHPVLELQVNRRFMSSVFFDAGDLERLDREARLTEQAPRQLPEEDRSPDEDLSILDIQPEVEPENDFDFMIDGLLEVLQRRLQ